MLLSKIRPLIPRHGNQKLALGMLLLFTLSIGFVVSYQLTNRSSDKTKAGSITAGNALPDKDGKKVYEVELRKENKDPVDILIKKGEYVQVNSKDGGQHQIVQGGHTNMQHANQMLDSSVFNNDEGYLVQFNAIGKYEFHDNYDHDYTMTVLVYDPDAKAEVN